MRWFAGISVLVVTFLIGAYLFMKDFPYHKYSQWVEGRGYDRYYDISGFRKIYLEPTGLEEIPPYQEDYVQLWKEFPLRNCQVPLPTRHPLFQTVPIIEFKSKTTAPHLGIMLMDPTGREISRVYTMPNRLYQDHSQGQDLFKLPFFRKRLLTKGLDALWKDIFSFKVEPKEKSMDEMIYDLYIIHLRSKILPQETVRYGLIKDGKQALIELESQDKDYMVELVLTQDSGSIFSYVLKTEINKEESRKLRAKFLESISFSPVDVAMGRLLYTEFKALNYARQVDQEGMLYLYAAWSQNPDNVDLLKEMITYLERGHNTKQQLKALYTYSFKRYGKTYTTRRDVDEQDNPELVLQRKIEIEQQDKQKAAEAAQVRLPEAPELTPDEKMNMYLKRAKEEKTKESQDMTVH